MPHVISTRITGFESLSNADQLRAAALALKREYAIASPTLKLAVAALGRDDRVMVAYETDAASSANASSVDWWWLPIVQRGDAIWSVSNLPLESLVYSEHGIATVEASALADSQQLSATSPPATLVSLAAEHAKQRSARASEAHSEPLTLWIDAEANAPINDEMLQWWSASLGVRFERLTSRPASSIATLAPVPTTYSKTPATGLDHALRACALASVACALLSGARFWSASASLPEVAVNSNASSPGELWARATLAVPLLTEHAKSAAYGGGAWVIAAPSLPVSELGSVEAALRTNAIAAQIVRDPEIRIRIQR